LVTDVEPFLRELADCLVDAEANRADGRKK